PRRRGCRGRPPPLRTRWIRLRSIAAPRVRGTRGSPRRTHRVRQSPRRRKEPRKSLRRETRDEEETRPTNGVPPRDGSRHGVSFRELSARPPPATLTRPSSTEYRRRQRPPPLTAAVGSAATCSSTETTAEVAEAGAPTAAREGDGSDAVDGTSPFWALGK